MEGWKNLVNSFYSLRFVLVIAEKPKQWYRASVTWSYQDWYGLHLGRFWATIDLAILIDENRRRRCRLYEGVVKQMQLCYASRIKRKEGIEGEQRPVTGRGIIGGD
jgi:hypothetical protein